MADPDYVFAARNGSKLKEDAGAETVYIEAGPHTVEPHTEVVGAPHVLDADDVGKVLTNTGAAAMAFHTLPAAVLGAHYHAYVAVAVGIRLKASGADTIRNGSLESAAGGFIQSTTVGSWLDLVCVVANKWAARPEANDWEVE